jgi:hypothetical protein
LNDENADIRRVIRRADPAATLAPVSADRLTRLTENALTTELSTTDSTARPAASPPKRSGFALRGLVVAGAGVLAAGAAAALVLPGLVTPPTVTVLALDAGDQLTTICLENTPETVATSELAFRAEVTGIDGGTVSLRVLERIKGDVGDVVQVEQGDAEPIDGAPIVFIDGETYLIASDGSTIGSCSASGIVSPELEALFDAAFPG